MSNLYLVRRLLRPLVGVIGLLLLTIQFALGQATINPGGGPTDARIIERLTGTGLGISNPALERGTRNTQIATFTNGISGAGFGLDEGVLFSTGNAVNDLTTRNARPVTSVNAGSTGTDPHLIAINPSAAFNTVAYSFDITLAPEVSGIRIVFQFGSEEYPDYVGSQFNDLFGFFVSGPGIGNGSTMQNFALLPSNNDVIAVNSVNGGVLGSSSDGTTVNLNQTEFYINNGHLNNGQTNTNPQPGPFPVHIEYNGITTAITRDIGGLQGGATYRFKVAIADVGDAAYDSGVLLRQIIGLRETDLSIEKTVSNSTPVIGDLVTFNIKATNKNIPAANAVAQAEAIDLLPSGYTLVSAIPSQGTYDPVTGLWDIGAMAVGSEEELVIQARVNATGDYRNLTNIQAVDAVDIDQTDNFDEATVVPIAQDPSFTLVKGVTTVTDATDVVRPSGAFEAVGDQVNYTITVENTGNVTLTDIEVTDPLTNLSQTIASLVPGASEVISTTYTITQPDLDAGSVLNTATATGDDPDDNPVDPEDPDDGKVTTPGTQEPSFTLMKSLTSINGDVALTEYAAVGDVLLYTITVENTGNVTLTNVVVDDALTGFNSTIASFAPGAVETFPTSYTITQADIDNGSVLNTATATGDDPDDNPIDPEDPDDGEVTTPGTQV